MYLFLVWRHRLISIVLSLCKHACKEVCDIKWGKDPYPLLAWSCNRWWPDFVTFTACNKSKFGFKRGKKAQCISKRCQDSFKRKKYFGVRCTLNHFFVSPRVQNSGVQLRVYISWCYKNWTKKRKEFTLQLSHEVCWPYGLHAHFQFSHSRFNLRPLSTQVHKINGYWQT